jgi:hypothetical protein
MKRVFVIAFALSIPGFGPAFAQIGTLPATPSLGATSPLGIGVSTSISGAGIPLGATEIASPGVSPAPTTGGITSSSSSGGTTCSTLGTSPTGMFGSSSSYDGGGMAVGSVTPATGAMSDPTGTSTTSATSGMSTTSGMMETSGLSGMCGSGSSSIASSSTPTSPVAPGGAARVGIPLGSTEISNLGVSSAAAVPTIGVSPATSSVVTSTLRAMPTLSTPTSTTPGG